MSSPEREIVAFDFHEVICALAEPYFDSCNQAEGTDLHVDTMRHYNLLRARGLPKGEDLDHLYRFIDAEEQAGDMVPISGAVEHITAIHQVYDLCLISTLQSSHFEATADFLDKFFPGCFKSLYLEGLPDRMGLERPKLDVCKEVGAVALVDDMTEHLDRSLKAGVLGIRFGNYPWNCDQPLPAGVVQCDTHAEVRDVLLKRQHATAG